MNVDDAIWKGSHKFCREQPHITCEANQIDIPLLKLLRYFGIMFGSGAATPFDNKRFDTPFTSLGQSGGTGFVTYNYRDLGVRDLTAIDGINQRDHI